MSCDLKGIKSTYNRQHFHENSTPEIRIKILICTMISVSLSLSDRIFISSSAISYTDELLLRNKKKEEI